MQFTFIALFGVEYGVLLFLWLLPAALCLVQIVYPSSAGWWVIALLYLPFAGAYLLKLATDVFRLLSRDRPLVFVDFDDSLFLGILIVVIVITAIGLLRSRPR